MSLAEKSHRRKREAKTEFPARRFKVPVRLLSYVRMNWIVGPVGPNR